MEERYEKTADYTYDDCHGGSSCIWLYRYGKRSGGGKTLQIRKHSVGAESAVEAEGIDAQALKKSGNTFHAGAGEQFAVVSEGDGGENGKL